MRLDIRHVPGISPLVRDYIHAFHRLAPFYAGDPRDPGAYGERAEERDRRPHRRDELRSLLLAQNQAWGAPEIVRRRIEDLCRPLGVAVVTGQQTGLFGGPLFTLYKALTAVRIAGQLQGELGRPVVPVFWMTSEDHDVAEADHVTLWDGTATRVTLRHASWHSPAGFLPANLRLGPAIGDLLRQVWDLLPATDFTPALRETLGRAFAPERTLAEAFARWMVSLLGDHGLVLVDPADPGLKRLAAGILRRELEEAPGSSQRILEATQSLRALGYTAQIEARPDGANCFLLREGRRPLVRDGRGFRLRDSGELLSAEEIRRLAQEQPECFSPNVALRPIVQDHILPTIAYVAGPGELAYFAQLQPLYGAFEVPMPLVLPRATLTLLEPRNAQLLERFRLALPDLALEPEQLASRVLRAQLPREFESTLGEARHAVEEIFRGVGEAIAAVDPTLTGTARQAAGQIKGHLDQLERKAVQALKRRDAEIRQQVRRLRELVMPGGKAQERVFPALPFLAKFGPGLIQTIFAAIDGPGWHHQILTLKTDSDSESRQR
jgi:bacillithiol biosynthesis cysteine-adding enzyme BshC